MFYANYFVASGANDHNVGHVDSAFLFDDAAFILRFAGFHVFVNLVDAFYHDAIVLGIYFKDFARSAFIFTGDNHYVIAFFNV